WNGGSGVIFRIWRRYTLGSGRKPVLFAGSSPARWNRRGTSFTRTTGLSPLWTGTRGLTVTRSSRRRSTASRWGRRGCTSTRSGATRGTRTSTGTSCRSRPGCLTKSSKARGRVGTRGCRRFRSRRCQIWLGASGAGC
ncbi:MAG: hypothetical protein AVDCRST_MAG02-2736, partial [uncultured Rubrobacteraceae bacterium]